MPNIATVLKQEISRLSRKESRSQIEATRKASVAHRRDIAVLKKQVAQLERQVKVLLRRAGSAAAAPATETTGKRVRFVAKGLRTQRSKLGLSAGEFGSLVGVSAQSIYNWEREVAHPRGEQVAKLAALRGIGKREAQARLAQGAPAQAPKAASPKTAKRKTAKRKTAKRAKK